MTPATERPDRLRDLPAGVRVLAAGGGPEPPRHFSASVPAGGRGQVTLYPLFDGVGAACSAFAAPQADFHHDAAPDVLEVFYCRGGRVGWNMRGGVSVYLGAGEMTAHSAACCADSAMLFPLGWAEGVSFSFDLGRLGAGAPPLLREAGFDAGALQALFCGGTPAVFAAGAAPDRLFGLLDAVPPAARAPLLKLKAQELLLCLPALAETRLPPCGAQQTELVRKIHALLTAHLDRRYTIEALAKQYLINTSSLKAAFKAVYGLPIARYMKEYRMHRAMALLRQTDTPIAEIARQVGYETQGKFTRAFKEAAGVPPTAYRRRHRAPTPTPHKEDCHDEPD